MTSGILNYFSRSGSKDGLIESALRITNSTKTCLYDIILDIHFRRFYPNDRTSLDHLESKSFLKNKSGELISVHVGLMDFITRVFHFKRFKISNDLHFVANTAKVANISTTKFKLVSCSTLF